MSNNMDDDYLEEIIDWVIKIGIVIDIIITIEIIKSIIIKIWME